MLPSPELFNGPREEFWQIDADARATALLDRWLAHMGLHAGRSSSVGRFEDHAFVDVEASTDARALRAQRIQHRFEWPKAGPPASHKPSAREVADHSQNPAVVLPGR